MPFHDSMTSDARSIAHAWAYAARATHEWARVVRDRPGVVRDRPRDPHPKKPAAAPAAVVPATPATVAPSTVADGFLTRRLLRAFTSLRRWEAGLIRSEAALIDYLSQGGRAQAVGFSCVADLCRENLGLAERTTRQRITLHRALSSNVEVERLFMDGKLTACQILALAPVLRGGEAETEAWIAKARRLTVRELKCQVRAAKPDAYYEERLSRRRFALDVPIEFAATYRQCIEIGRMVVGYDATPGEIVEAALAETGRAGLGEIPLDCDGSPSRRRGASRRPDLRLVPAPLTARDIAGAEAVLVELHRFKRRLARFFDSHLKKRMQDGRLHPNTALDHLEELRALHNPLRILQSRLIRAIRRTRCDARLGFDTQEAFVADRLGVSPRLARELVSESYMFEHHPPLETAYADGRIGITKAQLIRRMTGGSDVERWIDRAEAVMHRPFERECDILTLLHRYDPRIARPFAGPFPHFRMERILFEEVRAKHGLNNKSLERVLTARGVRALPARGSLDPAQNPPLAKRLEVLVHLLCTSSQETVDSQNRRQMFAVSEPHVALGFGCSDEVMADLQALYQDFDRIHGPLTQPWVPFILMLKEACDSWRIHDPERIPTHEALLRRDDYRCTFPGCSRRRTLEENHIEPKARGGSDKAENLTTLCFTHHREVFHTGYARITGKAPHALRYEIGISPGRPPLLVTLGNLIIERRGRAVGERVQ